MVDDEYILRVNGLSKRFGGVQALDNVDFDLRYGEIHALVGENGAGKSTLIKVLGGVYSRDSGKVEFDGKEVIFNRPIEAQEAGIAIIYQELSLMSSLNVIENIFMGRMTSRFGIIDWKDLERRTREVLDIIGLDIDPNTTVSDLTISQRQMIEIAKALAANAKLIIMDEPNSSLSETETKRLFGVIESLMSRDISILYVSHKIEEVMEISDRITVFRDGCYIGTENTDDATEYSIINMMVGRELDRSAHIVTPMSDEIVLDVRNLTGKRFKDVSFTVQRGEIVGFSGLMGAGRTDLARAIFGAESFEDGQILLNGNNVKFKSTSDAIANGLAMVQEDRKLLSLFIELPVKKNISIAELPRMTRFGVINEKVERTMSDTLVNSLDIRLASIENPVSSLSGGNQQKTVLARWLATNPKLLILDEPTHGVDVGAKAEIYNLIRNLAKEGVSIILISSELPDLLAMSYRIVVMHEGRVTGIVHHENATEDNLMAYATGVADDLVFAKNVA